MTEPSSKSEVCQKCGKHRNDFIHRDEYEPEGDGSFDRIPPECYFQGIVEPQPPVSAPEKCLKPTDHKFDKKQWDSQGFTYRVCSKCDLPEGLEYSKPDSAQPTPSEGPYSCVGDRSIGFTVCCSSDTYLGKMPCDLGWFPASRENVAKQKRDQANKIFAQGQASSAKEVEVYRKALESALKAFDCVKANDKTVYNYKGDGAKNRDGLTLEEGRWATPLEIATDEMKLIQALLTSKPEPVAQPEHKFDKIRQDSRGLDYRECSVCGMPEGLQELCITVAPVRKWGPKDEVGKLGPGEMFNDGGMLYFEDLSPEVQDALNGRKA
jgi:hypothetical protein